MCRSRYYWCLGWQERFGPPNALRNGVAVTPSWIMHPRNQIMDPMTPCIISWENPTVGAAMALACRADTTWSRVTLNAIATDQHLRGTAWRPAAMPPMTTAGTTLPTCPPPASVTPVIRTSWNMIQNLDPSMVQVLLHPTRILVRTAIGNRHSRPATLDILVPMTTTIRGISL